MAEETRRSGRANKGQHTKNHDALDEPPAPPKPTKAPGKPEKKGQPKGKGEVARAPSAQSATQDDDEEEEDNAIIRCVCGDQRDIRGRQMICCDRCEAWQHNKCLNLPEGDYWEDKTYYCEQCKPEDHQELLAAMARGEKPWARKKGSKPKPRASDVKQEEKGSTPQQTGSAPTPPPQEAPEPAPEAPSPPPAALKEETQEPANANGNGDAKPQSPAGEKRRHETPAEKANASKKRRKSSQQQDKAAAAAPPSQSAPATDIDALPPTQKPFAEKLRDALAPLVTTASTARGFRIPDGDTAKSLAARLALQVSIAAVNHYGEPSGGDSPFSQRLRAIMFNMKKNTILVDRVLSGSLHAQDLATMPIEEMASEDKQKEFAAMREAAEKQMILTEETGPRLRKTHKGEEIVGEDNLDSHEFKQPVLRERESVSEDVPMPSPVARRPSESPAEAAHPASGDTPGHHDGARRPSTNFDINSVFDKVRSPQHDQQTFHLRRQSSIQMQEKQSAPVDDADVDRLLKDEDNDVDMAGYTPDPTVCWQGSISMQSMQTFDAVARHVAGGDFGQAVPWDKLLASTLSVQGRIESAKGDDYIRGLAHAESYDIAVLSLSPVTTEGRSVMDHFYSYFQSRGRWGVVPIDTTHNDIVRDLYIIPIEAGGSNLPPFIDMLDHCIIETPRKEHMVLLALVAKLPEVKPQIPHTPSLNTQQGQPQQHQPPLNGPSPSPVNPHGPQYSPMNTTFPPHPPPNQLPPQSQYGNPYTQAAQPPPPPPQNGHPHPIPQHAPQQQQAPFLPPHHQIPKAVEILGPYIDAPVVMSILVDVLSKNEVASEFQMKNIRHIVEGNPAARTDMTVFREALARGVGGGNGSA